MISRFVDFLKAAKFYYTRKERIDALVDEVAALWKNNKRLVDEAATLWKEYRAEATAPVPGIAPKKLSTKKPTEWTPQEWQNFWDQGTRTLGRKKRRRKRHV